MAKMYPPEIRYTLKSKAERRFFDIIRRELGSDWIALHSLGLTDHYRKPWAEIDFVLIGPPGVFCLEVKGGRVSRHNGFWSFTDGAGRTDEKREGPFEQVGTASAALRNYLAAKLPWMGKAAVGYGVLMPDIRFLEEGPDIEPKVLYDDRDAARPFSAYIRRLADYWHERLEAVRPQPIESLSEHNRAAVLEELRGDFDLRPSLRTWIGLAKDELLQLTQEQYRILDGLSENSRVLVRGGAGTGKTLLAIEEARRLADLGKRVFLCCYNRYLARFLREAVKDCELIHADHLHGFMASTVREAGIAHRLPHADEADLFAVFYPELCVEALMTLNRVQECDILIVDEAQDLLRDTYMEVFDAVLRQGLRQGSWRFFLDPYQDIFQGINPSGLQQLMPTQPAQFRLSLNCRNTKPIAITTLLLSGVECNDTLKVAGPEVEHSWYRDERHLQRLISNCIKRLVGEGILPEDIVILARRRLENTCLRNGLIDVSFPLVHGADSIEHDLRKVVRFFTVGSFKGLEADVVLLIEVDDLINSDALLSIYVGASRAKAFLAMFLNEAQRGEYEKHAFEYGQRLQRLLPGSK